MNLLNFNDDFRYKKILYFTNRCHCGNSNKLYFQQLKQIPAQHTKNKYSRRKPDLIKSYKEYFIRTNRSVTGCDSRYEKIEQPVFCLNIVEKTII